MAKLHMLRLADMGRAEEEAWLREMDDAARLRAERTTHPLRRRQRIAGEHLARAAAAEWLGLEPAAVTLRRLPSGRPAAEGCFLSLSHSDGLVVCAVGDRPLGVDAERIRPMKEAVACHCFTAAEQALLAAAPEEERERCFWRLWTGKEALVKRTGEGLAGLRRADAAAPPANVRLSWREWEDCLIALAEEN